MSVSVRANTKAAGRANVKPNTKAYTASRMDTGSTLGRNAIAILPPVIVADMRAITAIFLDVFMLV